MQKEVTFCLNLLRAAYEKYVDQLHLANSYFHDILQLATGESRGDSQSHRRFHETGMER